MFDPTDEENLKEDMDGIPTLLLLLGLKRSERSVTYDQRLGRFRIDGRLVSTATIRRLLADIERVFGKQAQRLTADYFDAKITLDEWSAAMERKLTSAHWAAAGLSAGGLGLALQSGILAATLGQQIGFKNGFADDLKKGKVSENKARSRAKSYTKAVYITYCVVEHGIKRLIYREARRIRRALESCPACVDYATRGWIPVEQMPSIGSLTCRWNCRCVIEYRV